MLDGGACEKLADATGAPEVDAEARARFDVARYRGENHPCGRVGLTGMTPRRITKNDRRRR